MNPQAVVPLTADLIEAFAGTFLSPMYDNPAPTPPFHRQCWALYCSDADWAGIAAPRFHAKSTALTHDYAIANAMFRAQDFIIIVSATEDLAKEHLGDIAKELRDNDDLREHFDIIGLSADTKTDIIVQFKDGHECRFLAKGSGQKMRGLKWKGKRPGLVICDDLEEDEQVENYDRRKKFRRWFNRALLPSVRRGGLVRMHGTILHEDSLLARITSKKNTSWRTLLYKAHHAFDDFSDILWPQQWSEDKLRRLRQVFIDDFDAAGYSQEMLNDPFDNSEAYLRKDDFIAMDDADWEIPRRKCVGCDFAVSKADKANRTSFTVGGEDARDQVAILDQYVGRWDTGEWIDILFDIQAKHDPEFFFVEDGVIWKSVSPMIYKEMNRRGNGFWINFVPILPVRDKATRGRDYQKRHRAGAMVFPKDAYWYEGYEAENLRFTGMSDAILDDQFDSTAILIKGFNTLVDVEDEDLMSDEYKEHVRQDPRRMAGRNKVTGY